MTVTYTLKEGQQPTQEQIERIEAAAKEPIVYDDDCPQLSPAMIKAFRAAAIERNRREARRQA